MENIYKSCHFEEERAFEVKMAVDGLRDSVASGYDKIPASFLTFIKQSLVPFFFDEDTPIANIQLLSSHVCLSPTTQNCARITNAYLFFLRFRKFWRRS